MSADQRQEDEIEINDELHNDEGSLLSQSSSTVLSYLQEDLESMLLKEKGRTALSKLFMSSDKKKEITNRINKKKRQISATIMEDGKKAAATKKLVHENEQLDLEKQKVDMQIFQIHQKTQENQHLHEQKIKEIEQKTKDNQHLHEQKIKEIEQKTKDNQHLHEQKIKEIQAKTDELKLKLDSHERELDSILKANKHLSLATTLLKDLTTKWYACIYIYIMKSSFCS
jgi:hypothetical protein